MNNLIYEAEEGRILKTWNNCLGQTGQANAKVTLTDNGLRIYRTPDHDGQAIQGHGWDNWGGFKFTPMLQDSTRLTKGHTYIIEFHVQGKTCDALQMYWTNNMGWGGGGLNPSPSNVSSSGIGANFNGEKDCFYKFTINDDIYKTCTSSYSSFVQGTVYLSYRDFVCHFSYSITDSNGTDLYFTNFRMYDITNNKINITKTGILYPTGIIEQTVSNAKILSSQEAMCNNFYEY